jgi:hypothetical protein
MLSVVAPDILPATFLNLPDLIRASTHGAQNDRNPLLDDGNS